ncbi:MAG: DUF4215 domain-containing protein [Deltaproteobacteria bacterium]|nr:DUF4215 domain-containing protein [Deltaproteobacteria bacterium]
MIALIRTKTAPVSVAAFLLVSVLGACDGTGVGGGGSDSADGVDVGGENADGTVPDGGPSEDGTTELLGDGFELDGAGWEASEVVVLPTYPVCGDGMLGPGEECDDWNRMNGDGCDWQCRLGDGDPPPAPEPGGGDYVPTADPVPLSGARAGYGCVWELPLVWTGSEFATAWLEDPSPDDLHGARIRFWRFDSAGRRIDAEWRLPTIVGPSAAEVVWLGDGFGLFFTDESGLWYLRLDATGKPMGSPVLVEGDEIPFAPAADVSPDGTIAVTWSNQCSDPEGRGGLTVRVRRIDFDGNRIGAVYVVDESAWGPADLAAGTEGYGLVVPVQVEPPGLVGWFRALRFEKLDASLDHPVYSGVLGNYGVGHVKWFGSESRWVTSWMSVSDTDGAAELRVAFFTTDGSLAGPPVRNPLFGEHDGGHVVAIAPGGGGLSLVTTWARRLSYMRADRHGVASSDLRNVEPSPGSEPPYMFGTTWANDGFAVIYSPGLPGDPLYLRLFESAE